jgi:hypothetical protein
VVDDSGADDWNWRVVEFVDGVAGKLLPWSFELPEDPYTFWNWPWTAKEAEEVDERVG